MDDQTLDTLAKETGEVVENPQTIENISEDFLNNLILSEQKTMGLFQEKFERIITEDNFLLKARNYKTINKNKIYIDFQGNKYEFQKEMTNKLQELVERLGGEVYINRRYEIDCNDNVQQQIHNLYDSTIFLFFGDSDEINPGTSALMGLSNYLKKKIWMYCSDNTLILGEGQQKMKKNFMIELSCKKIFNNWDNLCEVLIKHFIGENYDN